MRPKSVHTHSKPPQGCEISQNFFPTACTKNRPVICIFVHSVRIKCTLLCTKAGEELFPRGACTKNAGKKNGPRMGRGVDRVGIKYPFGLQKLKLPFCSMSVRTKCCCGVCVNYISILIFLLATGKYPQIYLNTLQTHKIQHPQTQNT